ncbi:MAG: hypothetical protein IKJ59_12785 [Clostridia bacterium]|nr:hypothetical protein [Clostridia bacterium]
MNQLSLAVRLQVKLVSRSLNRSIVEYPQGEFRLSRFFMCIQGQHGKDITHQGLSGKIYPAGYKKLFGKATKKRATKNFQLFLITLPVLVNIRVLLPLPSANLDCARCVCKQASTHSLARAFAPKKAATEKHCSALNHLKASSGTLHIGC